MFVVKRLTKFLIYMSAALLVLAFALMAVHVFHNDATFGASKYYMPPVSRFMEPKTREFSIALMSDTAANDRVLSQVIETARNDGEKYSFIMYLGDFVDDTAPVNFRWMMANIQSSLGDMPFYTLPGNHDVEKHHRIDKSGYNNVMGPGYYWFGYGDVLFIVMDSAGKYVEDEQFEWLRETLENVRPKFRRCIVFGHRPPVNPSYAPRHKMDTASADKFAKIIAGHKIDAMFFGHVHYFSREMFSGIPIYTTPAAGQEPRLDIKKYGYLTLNISKDGAIKVTPKYIDFHGLPRNHFSEWFADHILSRKLRKIVAILLTAAAVCMVAGIGLRVAGRGD